MNVGLNFSARKYSIYNFTNWAGSINGYSLRQFLLGGMYTKLKFGIIGRIVHIPILSSTTIQSLSECFNIHVQYEYLVEQVDKFMRVPRSAAEESNVIISISNYASDSIDVPYM